MKDFQLDSNLDIVFEDGDIRLVRDSDEISQRVATTLRTRLLEFEPAEDMGLTGENLYGKNVSTEYLESDIVDAITEQIPDVVQITQIETSKDDASRVATVTLKYQTTADESIEQTVNLDAENNSGGDY